MARFSKLFLCSGCSEWAYKVFNLEYHEHIYFCEILTFCMLIYIILCTYGILCEIGTHMKQLNILCALTFMLVELIKLLDAIVNQIHVYLSNT